jgi:hypothetical protein
MFNLLKIWLYIYIHTLTPTLKKGRKKKII